MSNLGVSACTYKLSTGRWRQEGPGGCWPGNELQVQEEIMLQKKVENCRRSLKLTSDLCMHSHRRVHPWTHPYTPYTQTRDWAFGKITGYHPRRDEWWNCGVSYFSRQEVDIKGGHIFFPLLHRAGCLFLHHIRSHPGAPLQDASTKWFNFF